MTGVVLREMRLPDDQKAISGLYAETVKLHVEQWPEDYHIPDLSAFFAEMPESDDKRLFRVAEMDGRIVGLVSASLSPPPQGGLYRYDGPVVYIGDVVVSASARRAGIGTALMQAVEEWARAHGAATIGLRVHVGNTAAQALYDREGYRQVDMYLRKDLD